MSMDDISRNFEAFGKFCYRINGDEPLSVGRLLWDNSTHFCMTNFTAPEIDSTSSKKKKKKFARCFDSFPISKERVIGAWLAKKWPGTEIEGRRLLVYASTKGVGFDAFYKGKNLFGNAQGGWEDLMLFSDSKLLFFVCTHEKEGMIFGDMDFFQQTNLQAELTSFPTWEIFGAPIAEGFLKSLLFCPSD